MKKLRMLFLSLVFALCLTTFALADVAGGHMIVAIGASLLVPVLGLALVFLALAALIKAIKRKTKK